MQRLKPIKFVWELNSYEVVASISRQGQTDTTLIYVLVLGDAVKSPRTKCINFQFYYC